MIYYHLQKSSVQFSVRRNQEMRQSGCAHWWLKFSIRKEENVKASGSETRICKDEWKRWFRRFHAGDWRLKRFLNELTTDGGSLWQDSHSSHSSILQLVDGAVFGPPAVRANPQEVTHLVRSLTGIQDPPVITYRHKDMYSKNSFLI